MTERLRIVRQTLKNIEKLRALRDPQLATAIAQAGSKFYQLLQVKEGVFVARGEDRPTPPTDAPAKTKKTKPDKAPNVGQE